jgi:deazaflavin-dependent oxidoreductase (nitroreductase family)
MDFIAFNVPIIEEFRANAGVVGGMFAGMPMVLVHNVGAKSGKANIAPLAYARDGDNYVIFASKGGAPENPAWFHNLVANPDTTIEVGTDTFKVRARVATGDERERIWTKQKNDMPQFAGYEQATTRVIPVVVLEPR